MAITFPVGFLFRPTDKEVIKHYLLKKQMGEELPLNGVIQERDVYSEEVLSEIFRSSETHVYFFTQLKKKYLKGSNHDRTVGKATWRSESVDDIRLDENTIIGKKRVLDYINPGSVEHGDWNMKEFSLDGVFLEIPQTSSDYVVCLLEKKEQAIKRDRKKNMQSKKRDRGALENLPSGCFNYKRIKPPSKQNQQTENQQTESAPLVDEQVGLINGEAGVETLEQIMQYLLESDSSMVDVDEENVEQMMQYLLQPDSPLDSMPPLMEAKPAPTVGEDGGYPSGENEIRMQNQQMENQQTESAPLVDERVGLINGEAGVETLEQIMQYLLEPDSSMVDVDEENVEQMMQYLLQPNSPLDSMPPLMEAIPAPTVDEDGGHPSGENESSDYVVCLLEKKERAIKRDRKKNMQSKKYAGGALVNLPSGCDPRMNKRMRFCEEKNQRIEQLLMKSTVEASATSFPAYGLPITVIESAPIAQQVASIHGESAVESMVNVENVVATNTLATLPPSASYDLLECTSMPPLVEDKPAATVDEEGGCTSRKQEIRMLPVEKSHLEYQPSIAAPELLADDAVMDSIILLSTTVEGFAEDFIENFVDQFLNGN